MARFMLLLHDDPSAGTDASPEEIQAVIGEYVAWRQSIEAQGKLVGSEKLADDGGRELTRVDGRVGSSTARSAKPRRWSGATS